MPIKNFFGYDTAEELDNKMREAHMERDDFTNYSVNEISFITPITHAVEAKTSLLNSLPESVASQFDEKGRIFVPIEDFEDASQKVSALNHFRSKLTFAQRKTLYNFPDSELLSGKIETARVIEIQNGDSKEHFTLVEGARVGRVLRKVLALAGHGQVSIDSVLQGLSLVSNEKVSGYLVLSVNPFDFLSMSWGQSWSSCVDVGGEYETGSMCWATDSKTMIGYLISESQYDIINTESPGHVKKWRKLFSLDEDSISLLANKGYPYHGEGITKELILSLFPYHYAYNSSEYAGLINRIHVYSKNRNQIYNDVSPGNKIMLFTNTEYENLGTKEKCITFKVGEVVNCLSCDRPNMASNSAFMGTCCHSCSVCDCCGEVFYDESDIYYVDYTGEDICEGCLSDYFEYVPEDNAYYPEDKVVILEDTGKAVFEESTTANYCDECENYYEHECLCEE